MAYSNAQRRTQWLSYGVHSLRVAIVVALLLAIPSPQRDFQNAVDAPDIESVRQHLPAAHAINPTADSSGLWSVCDQADQPISKIARTLPIAADVVGYRGPTQSLIVFDDQLNIQNVALLSSADTEEHVDAIIESKQFFQQFRGWPWGGPQGHVEVDAVSGATLTSLALAEGVLKRIGGERPSLVFAEAISHKERREWLTEGEPAERLIRTGPLSDDITGYQGPTELLLKLSNDQKVERVAIRYSFDNESYVDYVRTEASFWTLFTGKSMEELAAFDPEAAGVEGVSGATMTSIAVADTVVAAAKSALDAAANPDTVNTNEFRVDVRWTFSDVATMCVLVMLLIFSRLGWFRKRGFRRLWLASMFLVIGLWAGNLVSMALIAGWSAEGIAWRLAPGLAAIAAISMLTPPLTKGNPYCNHLCPHGAVQQLIRPGAKSKRRLKLPANAMKILTWIPGVTLVVAYGMLISMASLDLSAWEPFHAYLFRIAGWGAIVLAAMSLLLSAFLPMGYCRVGCPTGRLLDHLRRTSASHRISLADIISVALLIIAVIVS